LKEVKYGSAIKITPNKSFQPTLLNRARNAAEFSSWMNEILRNKSTRKQFKNN
jgi:hypothetical protein